MVTKPKPLTTYYGGKSVRLAKIIVDQMPEHRIYCEPFFGMGAVLLTKFPSEIEVVNDLSKGLVNLFKVVRNPELCQELIRRLDLTPYARDEWKECQKLYLSPAWDELDQVEKARVVYVSLDQSFCGTITDGWSFGGYKYTNNLPKAFYNGVENIPRVQMRLRTVQIDSQDALTVMKRWDGPETLFYLDPPYVLSSRSQKTKGRKKYEHEMEDNQHQELLSFCLKSKSKIILSGYESKLYCETLDAAGWSFQTFQSFASSAVYTDANGLKGKSQELTKRTEYLWFNPAATTKNLWNQGSEAI
jgi:DNA adenine methylase